MRVVVTGAGNPVGQAIVQALVEKGHMVRLFGVGPDVAGRLEGAQWYAGDLDTVGSIEPVLAEREVLIHVAPCDEPTGDKVAWATRIERSTLGCKYGAERELVEQFIHVAPHRPGRFAQAHERAAAIVESCRKVEAHVVTAQDPATTAKQVLALMDDGPRLGRYPGRENDAVAA